MRVVYAKAKEVFELDGRIIYNATNGEKLEEFPSIAMFEN